VVITEVESALEKMIHKSVDAHLLGELQQGMRLVEEVLGNGRSFRIPVNKDEFGSGMDAAERQIFGFTVRIPNPGFTFGAFTELIEVIDPVLRHHHLGPGNGTVPDIACRHTVPFCVRVRSAEYLDHKFLGEVCAYLLVGADDDVVLVGIPTLLKLPYGIRIDEWRKNAALVMVAKQSVFEYGVRLTDDLESWGVFGRFHGYEVLIKFKVLGL